MKSVNTLSKEIGAELLKSFRAPEFILPTILMPTAFYTLFAVVLNKGNNSAAYLLATYGVFAVMGPAIFGFGVGVANERDRGWLQLKRAMPTPAYSYVLAKLVATLLFCSLALLPIYAIAGFSGGVELTRASWLGLFAIHVSSAIPFVFIGLTLGFRLSSAGAVALSNIIYLGLAILGGLWIPVFAFPSWMQTLSQATPSYHLAELALTLTTSSAPEEVVLHVVVLMFMTAVLAGTSIYSWSKTTH